VTQRSPHDSTNRFVLWNRKQASCAGVRGNVIVAHAEWAIGESIALLLRLKGFGAETVIDLSSVELMLGYWTPDALLLDTRLGKPTDFRFVRAAATNPAYTSTLLIALSNFYPAETADEIRRIGFDGLCQRPCPLWQLTDILAGFFAPAGSED
jgi:DNA-binding response OmpR family regulator